MSKVKGVYMVQFDNGIKVGISDNCHERFNTYRQEWNRPIKQTCFIKCQYPRMVEYKTTNKFKSNIIGVSKEFIQGIEFDIIKQFITENKLTRPDKTETDQYWINQEWEYIDLSPKPFVKLTAYRIDLKNGYFKKSSI